jgi:predicted amidohydrolase YtcJ
MTRVLPILLLASMSLAAVGCDPPTESADLVLRNGKVVTLTDEGPEVSAIAFRGDRIAALGSDSAIEALIGPGTYVVDLEGRLAMPGFIEGHGHFMGIGDAKLILDLRAAATWDEIVEMVADAVRNTDPGEWIRGRGWHQDKWEQSPTPSYEGFPLHASLSAVSPENPVLLRHTSGHASIANARAMDLAGIDATTPDPPGGEILRGPDGQPTGLMRETAQRLVRQAREEKTTPEQTRAEQIKMAALAAEECVRKGITSFQDAGSSFATAELLKELVDDYTLPLRLWVMIRTTNDDLAANLAASRLVGYGDNRLTVAAVKL